MPPRSRSSGRSAQPVRKLRAHQAARTLIRQQLDLAAGLIPAVVEGSGGGEPLHDLRVALRRARSLAQLLGEAFAERSARDLSAQLRAMAEPTGELRDLDVHLQARAAHLDALPQRLRPAGERAFEQLAALQRGAHAHLISELQSEAYRERLTRLRDRLGDEAAWPAGELGPLSIAEVAPPAIAERHRVACKRARHLDPSSPESEVHRLRIACKKLRYALEFFGPALGDSGARATLLRRLKRVQNKLGQFNDWTVQRDRLLDHPWGEGDAECLLAVGAMVGQLQARIDGARPGLSDAAAGLCEPRLLERLKG